MSEKTKQCLDFIKELDDTLWELILDGQTENAWLTHKIEEFLTEFTGKDSYRY